MYLSYYGVTSEHVIFACTYYKGDWEYTPDIIIASVLPKPEKVQLPKTLPPGTEIGNYTVPPEGLVLNYATYEPYMPSYGILDLLTETGVSDFIGNIIALKVLGFYRAPESAPYEPALPYSIEKDGYKYHFPDYHQASAADSWRFVGGVDNGEGVALLLSFVDLAVSLPKTEKPADYADAIDRCLVGGGYHDLIPQICIDPCYHGSFTNFCISTADNWSGSWSDGFGSTYHEGLYLCDAQTSVIEGFTVRCSHSEYYEDAFFGSQDKIDQAIHVYNYGFGNVPNDDSAIITPIDDNPGNGDIDYSGVIMAMSILALSWIYRQE